MLGRGKGKGEGGRGGGEGERGGGGRGGGEEGREREGEGEGEGGRGRERGGGRGSCVTQYQTSCQCERTSRLVWRSPTNMAVVFVETLHAPTGVNGRERESACKWRKGERYVHVGR